jgi:hypothetical protein
MPNQLNYQDRITTNPTQRPSRVTQLDRNLIDTQTKQILFGTTDKDNIELWIYYPDGNLAGHVRLEPSDPALSLVTLVDNTGPYEVLNLDLHDISNRLFLDPGRYIMVSNFFRDEVGSENRYKLYIDEISQDRTEVRLRPVKPNSTTDTDIYEFITPSTTRLGANAIIDEVLGQSTGERTQDEFVSIERFVSKNEEYIPNTLHKLLHSNAIYDLFDMHVKIMQRVHKYALDYMDNDSRNYAIQQQELENYLETALHVVIQEMIDRGEISPLIQPV